MRAISFALLSLVLVASHASGQAIVLTGSAGPTITDPGTSAAAGIGFSPIPRLTLLVGVERTHLSSRVSSDGRGGSFIFRGGTFTMAAAELQATILGRDRVSPYVLGGYAAGVSRPNVNESFRDAVTNDARVLFIGGGIHVPLRERLSVFSDVRMVFGVEGNEGIVAFAPVRAGVAWRF